MFELFFSHQAQVLPVGYAQDKAGGEVQTVAADVAPLACQLQQDQGPSSEEGGQGRRRSSANCSVYFPSDPRVRVNDRIRVTLANGQVVQVICEGPAFDRSGQAGGVFDFAVIWQVDGEIFR